MHWLTDLLFIGLAVLLVIANGFFVAAEFALVKVRGGRLRELRREGQAFAATADWLVDHMEASLSACQLGITMASLGLGWVGEPAFAGLLEPLLRKLGVTSDVTIHTIGFVVAFILITAAHLVVGEQAPKIFAIRRPERVAIAVAVPLKFFYVLSYPLLIALNFSTNLLLHRAGMKAGDDHETPHTEEEIRALLQESRHHGEITRSEHRLLTAVFEFDDTIARKVMVPRNEITFLDIAAPISEHFEVMRRTRHSRFPVCERSLDAILGVLHVKELVGVSTPDDIDLRELLKPVQKIPEGLLVSKLLRLFQTSRNHVAFVVDEHGTVVGMVTLENVVEQIVGPVQDEFDEEPPMISKESAGNFVVLGAASLDLLRRQLEIDLESESSDTLSGLLVEKLGRLVEPGDHVELGADLVAEVLEAREGRAIRVRLTWPDGASSGHGESDSIA